MTDRYEPEYMKRRWFVSDDRERIVRDQMTEAEARKFAATDERYRVGERNLG